MSPNNPPQWTGNIEDQDPELRTGIWKFLATRSIDGLPTRFSLKIPGRLRRLSGYHQSATGTYMMDGVMHLTLTRWIFWRKGRDLKFGLRRPTLRLEINMDGTIQVWKG